MNYNGCILFPNCSDNKALKRVIVDIIEPTNIEIIEYIVYTSMTIYYNLKQQNMTYVMLEVL
jgi:hypothetical protein